MCEAGRRLLDDADELVAEHTGVGVVAADQFQVGVADSGLRDADEGLVIGRRRAPQVGLEA